MLGIYCRTSKNDENRFSLENQREKGIECAKDLGLEYKIFTDDGISGTTDDTIRDGLAELFRDIKKKEVTHIYCIDQSRIERNSRTWELFVAECLNNEVKYYPNGSFFDLDNATNRMFANLMSIVNAYYSEITSKKVRDANAKKAKIGKTHGLKPYGYKRDKDNFYVIDEIESEIVKRMFDLSLKGNGAYTIANILNDDGVPTKYSKNFKGEIKRKDVYTNKVVLFKKSDVTWRGNVISSILTNPIYKGVREWNRHEDKTEYIDGKPIKTKVKVELITSEVPKTIEPELWDAVQKNLKVNKKKVGKRATYKYLLNGLLTCTHCGRLFVGKKRLSSGDNSYKCKGKVYPKNDCNHSRAININKLESFIIKHLFKSKELKKYLDDLPKNEDVNNTLKERFSKENAKLITISKNLKKVYDMLLSGFENDEEFKSRLQTLKVNKEKQINLVEKLEREMLLSEKSFRESRTKRLIAEYTEKIEFDEVKSLIHSLIENIQIEHHKEEAKMGNFILKVKYKGYDEISTFLTNWKCDKWYWINKYRNKANTLEELESDRQNLIERMSFLGIEINKNIDENLLKLGYTQEELDKANPLSDKFEGTEQYSIEHEIIEINKEDLVYFD